MSAVAQNIRPMSPNPVAPIARYSIRTGLIALVIGCLLPSLGALGIILFENHLQRGREVQRETLLTARGLMATIDRDLTKVESGLQVLAASNRLAGSDLAGFHERLRTTARGPMVLGYLLVDREGRRVLDSRTGRTSQANAPRTTALAQVFETGRPVLSNLSSEGASEPSFLLGVPVRRDSDVVFALAAELSPRQLARILEQDALPAGWSADVLDGSGAIVARSRPGAPPSHEQAGADLLAHVGESIEGTFVARDAAGRRTITSHTRSSLVALTMVVGAPRTALLAQLSGTLFWLVAGGALVLAITLWCAFRLAGNVTRAVEGLIEPALALGSGGVVELPPTRLKEADAVGRAIEKAAWMLAEVKHQAHHDALTGLCNRVLFDEVAVHQLAAARRAGQRLAVLAIDLDGFKAVNDRHGHAAGDVVLKLAAERIQRTTRASDVVSRRGGDEFTVLLGDVGQVLTRQIAQKLVTLLSEPYPDVTTPVSASIGVALFPESGSNVDELLGRADEALYEAKKAGKHRVCGDA